MCCELAAFGLLTLVGGFTEFFFHFVLFFSFSSLTMIGAGMVVGCLLYNAVKSLEVTDDDRCDLLYFGVERCSIILHSIGKEIRTVDCK